ncbi:MAG: hypothetical protein MUC87_03515 [Bacteroidia bacterium]|jgi:hypothetical protein|nr:hypothetical protein [Bacteroidia bacterium]
MSTAASSIPITERKHFELSVQRGAGLIYNRFTRMYPQSGSDLDFIKSGAKQIVYANKDSVKDRRLDDLLFTAAACKAKGETLADTFSKLTDIANDYVRNFKHSEMDKQSLKRAIWKFYVLRELYAIFVMQINRHKKNSGEIDYPLHGFIASPYTLQSELKKLIHYCNQNEPEQFIYN